MKASRHIATGLVALMLAGSGAAIATAQSQPPAQDQASPDVNVAPLTPPQAPPMKADFRDHHGPRGDMRGHEGRWGGRGFEGDGPGQMFRSIFVEIDANGDGSVTQDEIDTFRASKVSQADASGDGALSIEEFDTLYREFTRERMVRAFQRLDADGDGVISQQEMDRRFGDVVDRMDRNDDGALSLQDRPRG